MSEIVKFIDVHKSFDKPVLVNLNLEVNHGEFIIIYGESGCGKSTLFNIIANIDSIDSGEYYFLSEPVTSSRDFSNHRLRDIGFIFQDYNLIPELTTEENIAIQRLFTKLSDEEAIERTSVLAKQFKIEHLLNASARNLSGGEQQRVAIARSLFMNPKLILADEPTGNLDYDNALVVMDYLKTINEKGCTIIMISHDTSLLSYASRSLQLKNGSLYES